MSVQPREGFGSSEEPNRSLYTRSHRHVELPTVSDERDELQRALRRRRSRRGYSPQPLTLDQLSRILWAAQGVTNASGRRTAPSAGALYPLELHLLGCNVHGLPAGLYDYDPTNHGLVLRALECHRSELAAAARFQEWVSMAPALLIIAAVFERTTAKYGERGVRYVHMEVGHAAQNVYLQAASLGIGTVLVGSFEDADVKRVLCLPEEEQPLALMPLGAL